MSFKYDLVPTFTDVSRLDKTLDTEVSNIKEQLICKHTKIIKEKMGEKRKKERKKLADELKFSRKKLRDLNYKNSNMEKLVNAEYERLLNIERSKIFHQLRSHREFLKYVKKSYNSYVSNVEGLVKCRDTHPMDSPSPPEKFNIIIDKDTSRNPLLPELSGIYFLWLDDVIVYVGRSVNIQRRLTRSHHIVNSEPNKQFYASYIIFNKDDLIWAESLYIGLCKPKLNFNSKIFSKKDS